MSFDNDAPPPEQEPPKKKISAESEGTPPTVLLMAFSGNAELDLDVRRGMEVEVTVTGQIVGHVFTDHYDRERNLKYTAKAAKLKIEDIGEIHRVQWKDPRATPGQTSLDVDGEPADAPADDSADDSVPEAEVVDGTVAEDAPALDAGASSDVPESERRYEDDGGIPRHEQVPEDAWAKLNLEQKGEVAEIMGSLGDLQEYLATSANNPTDEKAAHDRSTRLQDELREEFGIELLPPEETDPEEHPAEPAPPPADRKRTTAELLKRRGYLVKRRALPDDAREARDAEIRLIDEFIEERGAEEGEGERP